MISPSEMVTRVSAGGRLVSFFKLVCVYFVCVGGGGGGAEAVPRVLVAAVKCAPVLCLLVRVATSNSCVQGKRYARLISVGLFLSALGDACLVWPQLLLPGMAWFGAAHVAYIAAFGTRPHVYHAAIVLYAIAAAFTTILTPPEPLKIPVMVYTFLVTSSAYRGAAAWLAAAGGGVAGGEAAARAAGAALFLLSDGILGYSMFGGNVPYKQWLVMSTYYAGQLGIALSALEPPTHTHNTGHTHMHTH